jgi:hypothetical protein
MSRQSDALRKGVRVVFAKVPNGSYLSAGKEYRVVGADRRSIHFWSDATASGTSDTRLMIDHFAEFTVLG